MNLPVRVLGWALRMQEYVPDLGTHRAHDEAVLFAAHPATFHVWVGGPDGETCSFCPARRIPDEPVQKITEHPGGPAYAICDLRALTRRDLPVHLAGPFPTMTDLREAMSVYVRTAADPCALHCATPDVYEQLRDPATALDLLIEVITRDKRDVEVAA